MSTVYWLFKGKRNLKAEDVHRQIRKKNHRHPLDDAVVTRTVDGGDRIILENCPGKRERNNVCNLEEPSDSKRS